MKKRKKPFVLALVFMTLTGCTSKSNPSTGIETSGTNIATELASGKYQDDIRIGAATSNSPSLLFPVSENGVVYNGKGALPMSRQFFQFDPNTKAVGLAEKMPEGVSMEQTFGNTAFDSKGLNGVKHLDFGDLITTGASPCATIGVSFENCSRALVSPIFVVSPADEGRAKENSTGYFVEVDFDPGKGGKPISGTLKVSRCGGPSTQQALSGSAKNTLEYTQVHRKTDFLEWSVEQNGSVAYQGSLGFPVVGTIPKLVVYTVTISEHKI